MNPIPNTGKNPLGSKHLRPLWLTCNICKTVVRMFLANFSWILKTRSTLHSLQMGFRPLLLTQDTLASLHKNITWTVELKHYHTAKKDESRQGSQSRYHSFLSVPRVTGVNVVVVTSCGLVDLQEPTSPVQLRGEILPRRLRRSLLRVGHGQTCCSAESVRLVRRSVKGRSQSLPIVQATLDPPMTLSRLR